MAQYRSDSVKQYETNEIMTGQNVGAVLINLHCWNLKSFTLGTPRWVPQSANYTIPMILYYMAYGIDSLSFGNEVKGESDENMSLEKTAFFLIFAKILFTCSRDIR